MAVRLLLLMVLVLAGSLTLPLPAQASEVSATVPLGRRTWDRVSDAAPVAPRAVTYERSGVRKTREREVAHAKEVETDRFHFTTVRLWGYRDFLPENDHSDVLGIEINSAWGWWRIDIANISYIELADYPRAIPGRPAGNEDPGLEAATGATDLLTAFLVSPKRAHHGPHHVAAGMAFQLPTASDDTLGSGKWSLGPAVEYEYHKGRFYAAFVALQLWSVAGDEDRSNVNMLMIKPMITYDLGHRFKAVYMPYGISVYWEKNTSDAVYLPLGGGVQYGFRIGRQKMAASVQFFRYVLRSSKGSEYDLRFMLEFDF